MAPHRDTAYFTAVSPTARLAFGYVWRRADFPWLGIWEENYSRTIPPWNGKTMTRGMEFGASPFPEPRRQMIERGGRSDFRGNAGFPAKSGSETRCGSPTRLPRLCPEAPDVTPGMTVALAY